MYRDPEFLALLMEDYRSEKMSNIAKRLEDMVKDCDSLDFPQIRQDFSDTKIYWRTELAAPEP